MKRFAKPLRWTRRRTAIAVACAAMVLAPPAAYAHWSYIDTFATGTYGVGGVFSTPGFGHRHLERVYHEAGYTWCVWYKLTNGTNVAVICGTGNPTGDWIENAYAKTQCHNTNDNSGTRWTCQTTVT